MKKLKRTLLLFLGFIFSLELLHARCLFPRLETEKKEKKREKKKPERNNSPKSEDKLSEDSTDNLSDKI